MVCRKKGKVSSQWNEDSTMSRKKGQYGIK